MERLERIRFVSPEPKLGFCQTVPTRTVNPKQVQVNYLQTRSRVGYVHSPNDRPCTFWSVATLVESVINYMRQRMNKRLWDEERMGTILASHLRGQGNFRFWNSSNSSTTRTGANRLRIWELEQVKFKKSGTIECTLMLNITPWECNTDREGLCPLDEQTICGSLSKLQHVKVHTKPSVDLQVCTDGISLFIITLWCYLVLGVDG